MAALRENGFAVSARYDRRTARILVNLNTGVQEPYGFLEPVSLTTPSRIA
jgi:hypothetical protein